MNGPMHILGISGSLRRGSYNTALLRTAAGLADAETTIDIYPLGDLPLYDADVEREVGFPGPVAEFREAIAATDALLIASPEYNYSVTGVLKNAVDWASRGGADSPLTAKPVAIMGAGGRFGTLRSQLHLREILAHNRVRVVTHPQVLVDRPRDKFDESGLIDPRHRDQVVRLLAALRDVATA